MAVKLRNYPFWNAYGFQPLDRPLSIDSGRSLGSCSKIPLSEDKILRRLFDALCTFYSKDFVGKLRPVVNIRPAYVSPLIFEVVIHFIHFELAPEEPKQREAKASKFDALSLIVLAIFHSNVLSEWVTQSLSNVEKFSERALKDLRTMKSSLIEYTVGLDRILQLYTFNQNDNEKMTTEMYDQVMKSNKKLKQVIKHLSAENVQKLIPKESQVSPDHMLCSVIGIQAECADWLQNMDEETRGHEEDEYWIMRYLEDKQDQMDEKEEEEGGGAKEMSVEQHLTSLGFTSHRASCIAERLKKSGHLLNHQTVLYSAKRYVEEAFEYDILLKDTPRYPCHTVETGKWDFVSIPDRNDEEDDEEDDDEDVDDEVDGDDDGYDSPAYAAADTGSARMQGPDNETVDSGLAFQNHHEVAIPHGATGTDSAMMQGPKVEKAEPGLATPHHRDIAIAHGAVDLPMMLHPNFDKAEPDFVSQHLRELSITRGDVAQSGKGYTVTRTASGTILTKLQGPNVEKTEPGLVSQPLRELAITRGDVMHDVMQSGKDYPSVAHAASGTDLARMLGTDFEAVEPGLLSEHLLEVVTAGLKNCPPTAHGVNLVPVINLNGVADSSYQYLGNSAFPPTSNNEFLVLSHSTDHNSAQSLMKDGILFARSNQALDFSGHSRSGFYLTEDFNSALRCAGSRTRGAVVVFKVPKSALVPYDADKIDLQSNEQEWRELVKYNRSEGTCKPTDRNLIRRYKKASFVEGPLCIGGFTSNPKKGHDKQICVLSEEMAKVVGDVKHICGVLFL